MKPGKPEDSLAVILLAAGASSRMGRPKMLLPWGNTTVLGHLLQVWQELGAAQIAAVSAAGDAAVNLELDRLGLPPEGRIVNPDPRRGMFSSIQCAGLWKGWQTGLTHWAIVLGDQPHLPKSTLRALLDFASDYSAMICQPSRSGRPRHPVLLPREAFERLAKTEAETLKQLLERNDVKLLEMNEPGLDLDIDRPDDYEKARQVFSA